MPCSDYGPNDTIHEQSARIKDLTKVACDLLRALRRGLRREDGARVDWKDGLSSYTIKWAMAHDEEDRKRLASERLKAQEAEERKQALKKLTLQEQKLLGLR